MKPNIDREFKQIQSHTYPGLTTQIQKLESVEWARDYQHSISSITAVNQNNLKAKNPDLDLDGEK